MKDFRNILRVLKNERIIDYRILYDGLKNKPVGTLDKEFKLFCTLNDWKNNDLKGR